MAFSKRDGHGRGTPWRSLCAIKFSLRTSISASAKIEPRLIWLLLSRALRFSDAVIEKQYYLKDVKIKQ